MSSTDALKLARETLPTYQLGPTKPLSVANLRPVVVDTVEGLVQRFFRHRKDNDEGPYKTGDFALTIANDVRVLLKGLGPNR